VKCIISEPLIEECDVILMLPVKLCRYFAATNHMCMAVGSTEILVGKKCYMAVKSLRRTRLIFVVLQAHSEGILSTGDQLSDTVKT